MSSNSPQGRAAKLAIECQELRQRAAVAEKALAYANGFIANMDQLHANQANYCAELTAKLAVAEDALARLTSMVQVACQNCYVCHGSGVTKELVTDSFHRDLGVDATGARLSSGGVTSHFEDRPCTHCQPWRDALAPAPDRSLPDENMKETQ